MPNFEIRATADVGQATAGLGKLQAELGKTAATAAKSDAAISKAANGIGKTLPSGANQATNALTNLGRVVQDAPFGFIGIANNINPLIESFQRLKVETGSTKGALASLASGLIGGGGLGLAVSVVTSLLTVYAMNTRSAGDESEKAAKKTKSYAESLGEIVKSSAQEIASTTALVAVLKSETETRDRKLAAIEELKRIQPEVFNNLRLEKDAVVGLDAAYKAYLENFKNVIAAKLVQAEIESKVTRLLTLQGAAQTEDQKRITESFRKYADSVQNAKNLLVAPSEKKLTIFQQQEIEIARLQKDIQDLIAKLAQFSKGVEVKPVKIKTEVEAPEIERQLGSLFPPGKVVSAPKQFSPKLVLTPSIQINRGIDSQSFTLGLFKAFLNEQALKDFQEKATTAINQTFANIINDSISTFADTIGKTLAGQGSFLPNLFEGLIKGIGDQVKELGKTLVRYGVQMIIARKAIEKLAIRPEVAVIAGFALQILGSTLAAAANKKFGSAKFATGVRNFEGGIATVGERGPETVLLPRGSSVVPNNEVMAYGGGGITLMPSIAYDGTQFRIFLNRVDAKLSRTG